jgi:hypothetical protein
MRDAPDERMDNPELTEHLLDLERCYWQAIQERDVQAAMQLTDDPCVVAGAQGVAELKRESLGEMMDSAHYTLKDFRIRNPIVRFLDGDVAIVAYQVHEDLEVGGAPLGLDAAESSTWVRKDGEWVCAAHTESISGDPFGRDRR